MNSTVPPSLHIGMNHQGQRARHTSTVRNLKIAISEKIALLLHPRVDVPYSFVFTQLEFGWRIVST